MYHVFVANRESSVCNWVNCSVTLATFFLGIRKSCLLSPNCNAPINVCLPLPPVQGS